MEKPSRNEVKTALVICTFLLASAAVANTIGQRYIYPNTETLGPNTVSPQFTNERSQQRDMLVEQYGLGGSPQTPIVPDERIRDIKHWIKGDLKKGTFETVVLGIEEETDTLGAMLNLRT